MKTKKTKHKDPRYLIMDGRAHTDIDSATVLCCSETLEEARKDAKEQGDGVIYDSDTKEIVE